jgi:hypothetical protein
MQMYVTEIYGKYWRYAISVYKHYYRIDFIRETRRFSKGTQDVMRNLDLPVPSQ